MEEYDINFYPYVYDELEEIGLEIHNYTLSDEITRNYLNEIKAMIMSLNYFPERYRIIARHGNKEFRKVNVKSIPFSITYKTTMFGSQMCFFHQQVKQTPTNPLPHSSY